MRKWVSAQVGLRKCVITCDYASVQVLKYLRNCASIAQLSAQVLAQIAYLRE